MSSSVKHFQRIVTLLYCALCKLLTCLLSKLTCLLQYVFVMCFLEPATLIGVTHAQETRTRNLYQKLEPMHVTKIVQFDWSAVYQKLAPFRSNFL